MMYVETATFEKRALCDLLAIPFFASKNGPKVASEIDLGAIFDAISLPLQAKDFQGKSEEVLLVYTSDIYERRIALVGLGEEEEISHEQLRRAAGAIVRNAHKYRIASLSICLPDLKTISHAETAKALSEGVLSANYTFTSLKRDTFKKEPPPRIERTLFITNDPAVVLEGVKEIAPIMRGVFLARDLANGNADDVTPSYLASVAEQLATTYGSISVSIYDKDWIEQKGMGLYLAVAKGSQYAPKFIVARYQGNVDTNDHTVLVGKGLTFDTGGLNLKPSGNIEDQKGDMSGAAVVLGTLKALAELQLPINVTGVIAACENAIGSKAYKPGDVYRSMADKTVEITNTDAEGRLTLADALTYSCRELAPSRIIDIATLTGAMCVALGDSVFGIMGNSDSLLHELFLAGERTHERCWKFPLYKEYTDKLKSDIADLKNSAGREGGALTAGAFLKEFVEKTPWAHMDIAPVAKAKEDHYYVPKMATGIGVRMLVDYFMHFCRGE